MDDDAVGTKVCSRCCNEWPLSAFSPGPGRPDGLHNWCKPCMNDKNKARYHRKLEEDPAETRRKANEAVARYRARHGDERGKAVGAARSVAMRRLAAAMPAEFAAIYEAVLRERGLELRQ